MLFRSVSVTLPDLYLYLSDGDIILVDDGLLKFKVIDINGKDIICQILTGGIISNNKSINIPNVDIELPSLTDKDKEDLLFGIENNVDFIAASFIRNKNDVNEIRKFLDLNGGYNIQIISKIENQSGVDNIEEILDVSYGIMVARGDLGVEIPAEDVPLVQKMIIKKCNEVGKPVITATQMLDSMIRNPSPTRAETTDVSNAVLDGTDAVMLSGETASGKYPIESVDTMRRIILKTESTYNKNVNSFYGDNTVTNIVSFASCYAANKLHCAAIITPTASGYTPRMISKYRPTAPIIAISNDDNVINHLSLTRGVFCIKLPNWDDFEQIVNESILAATEFGFINDGDLVVITNGLPSSSAAKTNTMRIETAGNHISRGKSLFSKGRIKGRYKFIRL